MRVIDMDLITFDINKNVCFCDILLSVAEKSCGILERGGLRSF